MILCIVLGRNSIEYGTGNWMESSAPSGAWWMSITSDATGQYLAACTIGYIYTSSSGM
jgi:hypothetical protein